MKTTKSDKKLLKKALDLMSEGVVIVPDLVRDKHGFFIGVSLRITSGDYHVDLPPSMFPWPLEPMYMPKGPKEKLN